MAPRELVLSSGGLVVGLTAWGLAVGTAWLPVRERKPVLRVLVSLGVAALLAAVARVSILGFLVVLAVSSALFVAVVFLIAKARAVTVRRAGVVLALTGLAFATDSFIPVKYEWIEWPLVPFLLAGLPAGLLLLCESVLRRRPWYASAFSAVMFVATWAAWVARERFLSDGGVFILIDR